MNRLVDHFDPNETVKIIAPYFLRPRHGQLEQRYTPRHLALSADGRLEQHRDRCGKIRIGQRHHCSHSYRSIFNLYVGVCTEN